MAGRPSVHRLILWPGDANSLPDWCWHLRSRSGSPWRRRSGRAIDERPNADHADEEREAIKRDEELASGAVAGRTHDQVMEAARRALEQG